MIFYSFGSSIPHISSSWKTTSTKFSQRGWILYLPFHWLKRHTHEFSLVETGDVGRGLENEVTELLKQIAEYELKIDHQKLDFRNELLSTGQNIKK